MTTNNSIQTPATTTANTSATQMTVASFKKNYGSVSAYNVENGTDFYDRDECIAHANEMDEIFEATVETVETVEVIRAMVQPTDIVLNDDQKGKDLTKPVRGAIKQAITTIFQDVVNAGTPATKENVSKFIRAVEAQMPERKGMGANGNLYAEFRGEPYAKSTGTGTGTTTKSKFTMPVMDSIKLMELVMAGDMDAVMELKNTHEIELRAYAFNIANEKAEAQKAQAAKFENKVTALCADLCKIFGSIETAQNEAYSLINAYFENLATVATTEG